jgi:AraC-like DNA-binding protein
MFKGEDLREVKLNKYTKDPLAVKSFMLSDNRKKAEGFPEGCQCVFDGVILGLCVKGSGRVKVNFKEYDIARNSVVVVYSNQIFRIVEQSKDLQFEMMLLSSQFISEFPYPKDYALVLKMGYNSSISVSDSIMHNLLNLHALVVKYYNERENVYHEDVAKTLVYALFLEIAHAYVDDKSIGEAGKQSKQEALTEKFFWLLSDNYKQERNVAFYADKMCLTGKYLSTLIKKSTGYSIHEWISETIVIEARMRLKTTEQTVLQISDEFNFPNASSFCRFFKNYTGVTPIEYRNSKN